MSISKTNKNINNNFDNDSNKINGIKNILEKKGKTNLI